MALSECTTCPLARHLSNARQRTEDLLIHDMHTYGHPKLVYVGYASGGLGWDTRCLKRLLAQHYTHITIICIDQEYRHLAPYLNADYTLRSKHCAYAPENALLQRCHEMIKALTDHAKHTSQQTQFTIHWLPSAYTYYHLIQKIPAMRADVCTWIDPATSIHPNQPYQNTDSVYLPACYADRARDYILTLDNAHEPLLITSIYEHIIMQRWAWHFASETKHYQLRCGAYPVYPYEALPNAIQIDNTIMTPTTAAYPRAVQLLYDLATNMPLHRICIPTHIRRHLTEIVCSAPG